MPIKRIATLFLLLIGLLPLKIAIGQVEINPIVDKKLSLGEKISQGRINSIIEDKRGIVWIGTLDGLNGFDGYNTVVYRHKVGDKNTISNNIINSLAIDKEGIIWIGTNNGLNKFYPPEDNFKSLLESDPGLKNLEANKINEVVIDNNGIIWIATEGAGVVKYNPSTNKRDYITLDLDTANILNQIIENIAIDSSQNIWFANKLGVIGRLNSSLDEIEYFNIIGRESKSSKLCWINDILPDVNNKIWFSMGGLYEGLYYYDDINNTIIEEKRINDQLRNDSFISSLRNVSSIVNDKDGNLWFSSLFLGIYKVERDFTITCYPDYSFGNLSNYSDQTESGGAVLLWGSSGILWIGTNGYGLEYVPNFNFLFHTIKKGVQNKNFKLQSVRAFEEDEENIWISGYYNLIRQNKETGLFTSFLYGGSYYSLCNNPMNPNELFIGTEGGGLYVFNKTTESFINIDNAYFNSVKGIDGINVFELRSQGDSILWVGRNSGVEKYDLKSKKKEYIKFNNSISDKNYTTSIISSYIDHNDDVWFGSVFDGLWKYDKLNNSLNRKILKINEGIPQPQRINSIFEDSRGIIWLCSDNGILTSPGWDMEFELLTVDNGLANNFVYASLEDGFGDIWFSTNNGLSKWDIYDSGFTNYVASNGLQGNEFNTGAYFKDQSGNIYFGGINGYNYFKPSARENEIPIYPIILTSVNTDLGVQVTTADIEDNIVINLDKEVQFLNLEFSLLSFLAPSQNRYQYRKLEIDSNWIDLSTTNKIFLDKPSYGKHFIELRAKVIGKTWNEKTLKITIIKAPYIWETWYFLLMSVVLIILIAFYFFRRKLWKNKREKKKLSVLVGVRTKELHDAIYELKESNATKDRLFSIIAHDLRNPLNSLLGFSSLLEEQEQYFSEEEKKEFISIIHLSSRNLNNLLDNLLNWSRLQLKNIKPRFQLFEIKEIIDANLTFLGSNISLKELNIVTKDLLGVQVYADPDMIAVIVRNLLSNAIKFTNKQGKIEIYCEKEDEYYKLSFRDNGVGMDKDTVDNIFDAKKSQSKHGTNNEVGTGLGLLLCHDFANLNNGILSVSTTLGKGSCFYLYLLTE